VVLGFLEFGFMVTSSSRSLVLLLCREERVGFGNIFLQVMTTVLLVFWTPCFHFLLVDNFLRLVSVCACVCSGAFQRY
jgi:hypothetical protein